MASQSGSDIWNVPAGWTLYFEPATGSTNDDAKAAATQGVPHRTVFLADVQTAGRGRNGRSWVAPAGSSLLFSLVLRVDLPIPDLAALPAVSAADWLREATGLDVQVKWPNDLMVGSRKLGGILTETITEARPAPVVVGIGINVNVDLSAGWLPPTATSLMAEMGRPFDRPSLLLGILRGIDGYLGAPPDSRSASLVARWNELLWRRNQVVKLALTGEELEGIVEGLSSAGSLLLRTADGGLRELATGELWIDALP